MDLKRSMGRQQRNVPPDGATNHTCNILLDMQIWNWIVTSFGFIFAMKKRSQSILEFDFT